MADTEHIGSHLNGVSEEEPASKRRKTGKLNGCGETNNTVLASVTGQKGEEGSAENGQIEESTPEKDYLELEKKKTFQEILKERPTWYENAGK